MTEDLHKMVLFNQEYGKNALFFKCQYEYDLDNAFTVSFYEMLGKVDLATGICPVRKVGGFNGGSYYTSHQKDKAGFYECSSRIENGYPLTDSSISIGYLRVGYRAISFETNGFNSVFPFSRYWNSDLDEIAKIDPKAAHEVRTFLNEHIYELVKIQSQRKYKSTWVYYKYQDKSEYLSRVINGQILKGTDQFYSPDIHYNRYSSELVDLSERERVELQRKWALEW